MRSDVENVSCDKYCQNKLRQDYLMTLTLKGSNSNGTWSYSDYKYYRKNREDIFSNPGKWVNPDEKGQEGFVKQVERLADHYGANQKEEFVNDFALLFGGIPTFNNNWVAAAFSVAGGPKNLRFINEGTEGLAPEFLEISDPTDNQSHHYAGLLFLGYHIGIGGAQFVNSMRDFNNLPDILLGYQAAIDGDRFKSDSFSVSEFVNFISALSVYSLQ
jgi:hypothetical protein